MFTDWKAWTDSNKWMEDMVKGQSDFVNKMSESWQPKQGKSGFGPDQFVNFFANPFDKSGSAFSGAPDFLNSLMFMMPSSGVESMFKENFLTPDKTMEMFKNMVSGINPQGESWMNISEKIKEFSKTSNSMGFDPALFTNINKLYEDEFRKLLNVPKLGLTRLYQERMSDALDKYNKFNSQLTEFFLVLKNPVEDSFSVVRKELEELAKTGKLPENLNEYYQKWMASLEDHYLKLFKTSNYNTVLSKTLESMGEFMKTRDEIIEDTIKTMPVPTQKEMDDLYKDIYVLKKKIREMEKNNKKDKKNSSVDPKEV